MQGKINKKATPEYIATLENLYRMMLKIRLFEERTTTLLNKNKIVCPVHLYTGQEAIAAGVCQELTSNDPVFSTHRSHGHFIAKGGSINELMAELFGKEKGCSKGKGGSMHLVDPDKGFLGSSAIVAGSIPLAVGAALSIKIRSEKNVAVAFFGDGAMDEGVFYESLNFASLYKLPILFICENNLFSTHLPIKYRQANINLTDIAKAHKVISRKINGNNVLEVYKKVGDLIRSARNGGGPAFVECRTFRWYSHVGPWRDLDIGFRKKKDVEYWMNRCPIERLEKKFATIQSYEISNLNKIRKKLEFEIENAVQFGLESPYPEQDQLTKHVFAEK